MIRQVDLMSNGTAGPTGDIWSGMPIGRTWTPNSRHNNGLAPGSRSSRFPRPVPGSVCGQCRYFRGYLFNIKASVPSRDLRPFLDPAAVDGEVGEG